MSSKTSELVDLLGPTLKTADGDRSTSEVLAKKTAIGLYFSAHWCPPCRGFTPQLAKMYSEAFKQKGMEIVFVSSDRDEGSFDEYFKSMPWAALPFADRERKASLSKQFKVRGIPGLIILGPDGKVINKDGRTAVSKDPTGENFPWVPPTASEKAALILKALGPEVVAKAKGKPIGLYFSAHWCPPCRGFTPQLAEWYKGGLKDKMEIVFVSSDRDQGSFDSYFASMPWSALPFAKRDEKGVLSDLCGVQGIPTFAVIDTEGQIITTSGRAKVTADPTGATFPDGWRPQPFNDVNETTDGLNEESCLVALGNDAAMIADVKSTAANHHKQAGGVIDAMPYRFFRASPGGITEQIRKLTGVAGNVLILLAIPEGGKFYEAPAGMSAQQFLVDVKAGKIEQKSFKQ